MNAKDGLYHKEIGFPPGALLPWVMGDLELIYSEHAKQAADNDRYGAVPRLDIAGFAEHEVIEVEIRGGHAVKAVLRIPCDGRPGLDMILVLLAPVQGTGEFPQAFVKTVWFNLRNDKHKTLRRELYKKP